MNVKREHRIHTVNKFLKKEGKELYDVDPEFEKIITFLKSFSNLKNYKINQDGYNDVCLYGKNKTNILIECCDDEGTIWIDESMWMPLIGKSITKNDMFDDDGVLKKIYVVTFKKFGYTFVDLKEIYFCGNMKKDYKSFDLELVK